MATKRKKGNPRVRRLDGAFAALREELRIDEKLELSEALRDWKKILGPTLGEHIKPLFIKDRVLYVKTSNSVWMQEFNFIKAEMIRALNEKIGRQLITEIRFTN